MLFGALAVCGIVFEHILRACETSVVLWGLFCIAGKGQAMGKDLQRISVDIEFNHADILAEALEGMTLHVVATTHRMFATVGTVSTVSKRSQNLCF